MLQARTVQVPRTRAVAGAALTALGIDAPVTIDGGTARVQSSKASEEQVAEIVYTLTQFPSVQRVDVAADPVSRADVVASVPVILIEQPTAGAQVR